MTLALAKKTNNKISGVSSFDERSSYHNFNEKSF
uniref:Uncharacterized protein n=1 Tax=Podoviridae sp. ctU7u6 TaxID=2825252 RepID=A0A8S5P7Q4_9CAUD|nr:MAG TPA: hypothetical protein [Podoviridae sp. ctU7u6]